MIRNLVFFIFEFCFSRAQKQTPDVFCKKKVFLKTSQNLQENTEARASFLIKLPAALLKKRLWHRCFPVNFAKFLRVAPLRVAQNCNLKLTNFFLTEHLWCRLLEMYVVSKNIHTSHKSPTNFMKALFFSA